MSTALDPVRVEAAAHALDEAPQAVRYGDELEHVLAADDKRARDNGFVATGDGLTLEWVHQAVVHRPDLLADLPTAVRDAVEGQGR